MCSCTIIFLISRDARTFNTYITVRTKTCQNFSHRQKHSTHYSYSLRFDERNVFERKSPEANTLIPVFQKWVILKNTFVLGSGAILNNHKLKATLCSWPPLGLHKFSPDIRVSENKMAQLLDIGIGNASCALTIFHSPRFRKIAAHGSERMHYFVSP